MIASLIAVAAAAAAAAVVDRDRTVAKNRLSFDASRSLPQRAVVAVVAVLLLPAADRCLQSWMAAEAAAADSIRAKQ